MSGRAVCMGTYMFMRVCMRAYVHVKWPRHPPLYDDDDDGDDDDSPHIITDNDTDDDLTRGL